jgi:hypothetical protein
LRKIAVAKPLDRSLLLCQDLAKTKKHAGANILNVQHTNLAPSTYNGFVDRKEIKR